MSLFNVEGKLEKEVLAALEKAKGFHEEAKKLQKWINENQSLDATHADDATLENAREQLNAYKLTFEKTWTLANITKPKELQFNHPLVATLQEEWQALDALTVEMYSKKQFVENLKNQIEAEYKRRKTIATLRTQLAEVLNGNIPYRHRANYGYSFGRKSSSPIVTYHVSKAELVLKPSAEEHNSKWDLMTFYIRNSYPALRFSANDVKKPEFQELKRTLGEYLLAEVEYKEQENEQNWRSSSIVTYHLLAVKKGLKDDLQDAVYLYNSTLPSIRIMDAVFNEHGFYPMLSLEKKRAKNSMKYDNAPDKLARKKEQFTQLQLRMEQGIFHTKPNTDSPFLINEANYLVGLGYNKFVIAKLFGFAIDKINQHALSVEDQLLLEEALSKHKLAFYLQIKLELLETNAERQMLTLDWKLRRKYDI